MPTTVVPTESDAGYWPWLSAFFAGLWLLTLLLWLNARKQPQASKTAPAEQVIPASNSRKALATACKLKAPSKVINALIAYFSEIHAKPMSLQAIAATSSPLAAQIDRLQQAAYSQSAVEVDYPTLLKLALATAATPTKRATSALASLNP